jgi:OPA family glycerol-3-phosphate transporter-like MFS transporter
VPSEVESPVRARSRVFALSWLVYASYYLGRKGFSVVKSAVAREHGFDASDLAAVDTLYLLGYALGQLPCGIAADRFGPRRVLALGLLLSAAACAGFGLSHGLPAFVAWFGLNGLAQASGWPATTKLMAAGTRAEERGRIMGLWSTCYQVGGIAATALATWALAHVGWRAAFQLPAVWLLAMAVVVLLALTPDGARTQLAEPEPERVDLRVLLRLPVLYSYALAYFCIKLIRYSLLFWLPYYLHTASGFDEVTSGYLSIGFEAGGVLGSIALGYGSDRARRSRGFSAALSLLGLALALALYAHMPWSGRAWHFAALAAIGALLFGPDALLSGAAAQELGGTRVAATAVGFVNGMGSLGALLQSAFTVSVQRAFGWNGLLQGFVALTLLSVLCLWPSVRARRA